MRDSIKHILTSILLRTLETDPCLKVSEGIERTLQLVPEVFLLTSDLGPVEQHLTKVGDKFRRRGIVNPAWLSRNQKVNFHFYLVNAQPGWLRHLIDQTRMLERGIFHYILYGDWDSLIVLYGTDDEANEVRERIQSSTYYDFIYFSSHESLLFHRYRTIIEAKSIKMPESDVVNRIVENYDNPSIESEAERLEQANIILGPTWSIDPMPRITAFVGIRLMRGSHELSRDDVLESLLKDDALKICLVHLFEIDKGYPFHFFAKLVCQDMQELDKATNAIGFTRIGRIGLEGNTFVVASENEEFPDLRSQRIRGIGPSPDLGYVVEVANQTIAGLGEDAISKFNNLDGTSQLIILRSLDELTLQTKRRSWDDERESGIRSAIKIFATSSLEGPEGVRLAGAVIEISTAVENYMKHALRRIVDAVYERDYALAQNELKLPTKDFRRIGMGKIVNAFRTMKIHKDFNFIAKVLEEDWLDRLEVFTQLRNTWAHGGISTTLSGEIVIDEARRVIVEGIEIARWLGGRVLPTVTKAPAILIKLPKQRGERGPGIFVCHSKKDKVVAERIAVGLRALGYDVWYDEWVIAPADSIVQKIDEGLARNDTLAVLLSPHSVNSKWVRKELSAVLMDQLSGQDVVVLPLLIAECDIPTILRDIKYIDFTEDFQTGFVKILEFLRKRYSRG